ncbi:unnamed protein product [Prorocentrum cordatum]|uniref:Uncharacterized protein n=1 Tax=Prorocentrum cordatum TaxID=2364126 RepID=A0ABN9U5K3_9DINO|nr:unnamed protein product [Polarella glacialis]
MLVLTAIHDIMKTVAGIQVDVQETPKTRPRKQKVQQVSPTLLKLKEWLRWGERKKMVVSEAQVISGLRKVLDPKAPTPTPAPPQQAQVVDKRPVLTPQPWQGAPIVKAPAVRQASFTDPTVIACQSPGEYKAAAERLAGLSSTSSITCVLLNQTDLFDGWTASEVMVDGQAEAFAHFERSYFKLGRARLSVVDCLQGSKMMKLKRLKTKAAVACDTEATCILITREEDVGGFLAWKPPTGAFLNVQGSKLVPVWHCLREDEALPQFHARVASVADSASGRLVCRPSHDSSLGVLSEKPVSGDKCPETWTDDGGLQELGDPARFRERFFDFPYFQACLAAELSEVASKAGKYSTSDMARAVAHALKTDIIFFKKGEKSLQVYSAPREVRTKSKTYLALENCHYSLLVRNDAALPDSVETEWFAAAYPCPTKFASLNGGGRSVSSRASSKDAQKARRTLGLPTPARSSVSSTGRTAAARNLLGIHSTPGPTPTWTASFRGLPGKAEVIDGDEVLSQDLDGIPPAHSVVGVPERGSYYACPCGWSPNIEGRANQIAQQAIAHWRKCQEATPPKEPAEVKKLRLMNKTAIIRARRGRSWEKYKRWRTSLTEGQRPLVCSLQEDYYSVHTYY